MNDKIQRELQARIETFARDITTLLSRAVSDAMKDAVPAGKARRGRPPKSAGGGKKGAKKKKRAGKSIDEDTLLKEVAKEGGRRMEQIAEALGTTSKAIGPSMKSLIAAQKVKASGKARGMNYQAT
jgi:hypothetical protein